MPMDQPNEVPREGRKGQGEHGDGHSAIMGGAEEIRQCGLCSGLARGTILRRASRMNFVWQILAIHVYKIQPGIHYWE
jgi:hypothetical protein